MVQIIYPKKIHKQDLERRWENTSEKEMQFCHLEACPVWLCEPMDCSPPGCSVHGVSQARILERVAISFSRGSSPPRDFTDRWIQPKDQTHVSCIGSTFLTTETPQKTTACVANQIILKYYLSKVWSLPGGSDSKESACNAGSLGQEEKSGLAVGSLQHHWNSECPENVDRI